MPNGYALSDNGTQQFGASQFPSWMPTQAPTAALRGARKSLDSLFDFDPIAQTGNQYMQSAFNNQAATVGAASRAAQNRAMLSGGRVGSSYAGASAMLPLYQQRNEQSFKLAGLQGQMNAQRAGLGAQIAQGITSAQLGNRSLLGNYALGQQRLQQDESQFGRGLDLQRDEFDFQREFQNRQLNSQSALRQLQYGQPDGPTSSFMPYQLNDDIMAQNNANQFRQSRQQLYSQL